MNGAERAGALPEGGFEDNQAPAEWVGAAPENSRDAPRFDSPPEPETPAGRKGLAALLLLLAAAWLGGVGYALWQARPALDPQTVVSWTATVSGPLILLSLLWLMFGRTRRSEAERFTRAVQAMRSESVALESVLEIVSSRIEENHARLRDKAERLMSLGDEASDRLGRVTHYLAKESDTLGRQAAALDAAASAAKVDVGVLLHDLPKAEEQARAVAAAMKEAGLTAHGQAGALEAQLSAIAARGRDADEVLGNAAQRLAAHIARIDSSSAAAAGTMGEASASMIAAVDGAMERASEAIDAARSALDAQAAAVLAAIEQSRAALDQAGEESAQGIAFRLDTVGGRIQTLADDLAAQDAAARALVTGLASEFEALDEAFARLGRTGGSESEKLAATVQTVRADAQTLMEELSQGTERAGTLRERAEEMSRALAVIAGQVGDELPSGLLHAEQQAIRTSEAAAGLTPLVEGIAHGLDTVGGRLQTLAGDLAAQDAAAHALVTGLASEFDALDAAFEKLGRTGSAESGKLAATVQTVRDDARALMEELSQGTDRAGTLRERAEEMARALALIAAQVGEELPSGLLQAEQQATRTRDAAAELAPMVEGIRVSADAAAGRLGETESAVARQREALDLLLARIDQGSAGAEERLRALGEAASAAQAAAAKIVSDTGPELIDALVRVREAGAQAAERAREAIAGVIPASAAALGEAGREALVKAVGDTVERQMAELDAVSARAMETAQAATERLTRQMLSLGGTAAAIEARIDDARKEREEKESENLSRRVALLIESLNSTAIDVTKVLSNEVTDSAWAAYLKGDRGVFTRRAVRLLDATETREVARHYDEEHEFREQVNRYIHDFEAMLRRVLADRDGASLAVTILSSDMGKLYVALAQAIERLRK